MSICQTVIHGIIWSFFTSIGSLAYGQEILQFDFGKTSASDHWAVNEQTQWPYESRGVRYGLQGQWDVRADFVTAAAPFSFWLEIPPGNYTVSVVLGEEAASCTTIKAESRRLMIYEKEVARSEQDTVVFLVNVRSACIGNDSIRLKKRELSYLNWDHYLTLEFGGAHPAVRSVFIEENTSAPVIFLAGNSTVVDQESEPWASWGQMFPAFLKPEVVVANFAESGETLKAFIHEQRFRKIESMIRPGDFLLMEFAHNDQKPGGSHVDPFTTYQEYLMRFVDMARAHGATPVFVTSTNRRRFHADGTIINTLEEYPDAMRQLARQENILLIDLHAMSKTLLEALGPEGSKKAFVHYEVGDFPWLKTPLADDTHFSTYGAWQLARCVAEAIREGNSPLNYFLKDPSTVYNPASPDPVSDWKWPVPAGGSWVKPDGN